MQWQEMLPGAQQLHGAAETGPALLGHGQPGWSWPRSLFPLSLLSCLQTLPAVAAMLGQV